FDLVDVQTKDGVDAPRSFGDYTVTFNKSDLPDGVQIGFGINAPGGGSEIVWDTPPPHLPVEVT
ncbi:MAG: hypothetical protein ACLFWB_11120, partial [Armatimonadota bacterium]